MKNLSSVLAAALGLGLLAGCTFQRASPQESIGEATMLADHSIQLRLRAETVDGAVGDALVVLRPGQKNYDSTLQHLGGLEPGQSKLVPPWSRR